MVTVAGFRLQLAPGEWCAIVLAIMAVWTAKALNTAIEFKANVASPDFHPQVKHARNVATGAVLLSAIGTVITEVLIFGPHLVAGR